MKKEKIFLIIIFIELLFPLLSLGQGGLVPCGGSGQPECQLCHLFVLLDNIVNFFFKFILTPLASLLLVIGGFMFFFYAEDPNKVEKAKELIKAVFIGLVIIFSAWLVINLFLQGIGVQDWTGTRDGWWKIDCPS